MPFTAENFFCKLWQPPLISTLLFICLPFFDSLFKAASSRLGKWTFAWNYIRPCIIDSKMFFVIVNFPYIFSVLSRSYFRYLLYHFEPVTQFYLLRSVTQRSLPFATVPLTNFARSSICFACSCESIERANQRCGYINATVTRVANSSLMILLLIRGKSFAKRLDSGSSAIVPTLLFCPTSRCVHWTSFGNIADLGPQVPITRKAELKSPCVSWEFTKIKDESTFKPLIHDSDSFLPEIFIPAVLSISSPRIAGLLGWIGRAWD